MSKKDLSFFKRENLTLKRENTTLQDKVGALEDKVKKMEDEVGALQDSEELADSLRGYARNSIIMFAEENIKLLKSSGIFDILKKSKVISNIRELEKDLCEFL